MASIQSSTSTRIHALDTLRAVAMMLGIFLHAAIAYMKIDLPWAVRDESRRWVFDLFVGLTHGFRMQLFFVIAGFFGHLVCERIGLAAFVRHRFQRIVIPFIAGMLLLTPWLGILFQKGPLSFGATAHLWFLQYLIVYYALAYAAIRFLPEKSRERFNAKADALLRALLPKFWKAALLALPLILCMWFSPLWTDVDGSPGTRFLPKFRSVIYYGIFFAFGWWLHRNTDLLQTFTRRLAMGFAAAFMAFLAMGALSMMQPREDHSCWLLFKTLCLAFGALYTWLMIFGVTGFSLRYFHGASPVMKYLADASYWCYLLHLPLVIYFQKVVSNTGWDSLTKFAIVNAASIGILLASYQLFVRHTFIGRTLNGPRKDMSHATARRREDDRGESPGTMDTNADSTVKG